MRIKIIKRFGAGYWEFGIKERLKGLQGMAGRI